MDSDSDASHHSSSPSPSPSQQSPAASFHAEPSLQRLTTHFVNAKRSLNTTHHVFRANELVTSSRTLIEEIAALNARNDFATQAAEDGVGLLEEVRRSIQGKGDEAGAQFTKVIRGLDEANERLLATLSRLTGTIVDASLQREQAPNRSAANEGGEDQIDPEDHHVAPDEEKTLLSFIDTDKHESIQAALRVQIDNFNAAHDELSSSIDTFSKDIHVLHSLLAPPLSSPEPPELLRPTLYDEPAPTIPQLFHSITDNAGTMASLLQSLVSHYDLCVTALKHTEGGGEAARRAVQQQRRADSPSASDDENTLPNSRENMEESLYHKDHASPISDDERREMLKVLEHDSGEVDDVVAELGEHARELESAFETLAARARKARQRDRTLRQVMAMLHEMQDLHLPSHQHSLHTFSQDWARIRATISDSTVQLSDLSDFYADFFEGYKKLLREVDRRAAAEAQMLRIAEKAAREIERVWQADEAARAGFMEEVGSVLPGDLWPSLHSRARHWGVVQLADGEDEGEIEQSQDGGG